MSLFDNADTFCFNLSEEKGDISSIGNTYGVLFCVLNISINLLSYFSERVNSISCWFNFGGVIYLANFNISIAPICFRRSASSNPSSSALFALPVTESLASREPSGEITILSKLHFPFS